SSIIRLPPSSPSFPTRRSSDLLLGEGEPRIADNGLEVGRAALDVAEIFRIAGGIDHGLVDLEVLPVLAGLGGAGQRAAADADHRSEEHTSELQSQSNLVCRLLL